MKKKHTIEERARRVDQAFDRLIQPRPTAAIVLAKKTTAELTRDIVFDDEDDDNTTASAPAAPGATVSIGHADQVQVNVLVNVPMPAPSPPIDVTADTTATEECAADILGQAIDDLDAATPPVTQVTTRRPAWMRPDVIDDDTPAEEVPAFGGGTYLEGTAALANHPSNDHWKVGLAVGGGLLAAAAVIHESTARAIARDEAFAAAISEAHEAQAAQAVEHEQAIWRVHQRVDGLVDGQTKTLRQIIDGQNANLAMHSAHAHGAAVDREAATLDREIAADDRRLAREEMMAVREEAAEHAYEARRRVERAEDRFERRAAELEVQQESTGGGAEDAHARIENAIASVEE